MADPLFPANATVRRLRDYVNDPLAELDDENIRAELFGESDRAKVILSAAILDDALSYRIEDHIRVATTPAKMKHILRFEGPLGTFSSKIEIAYVFGFISSNAARQLHFVREMRNACAHSKFKLSFDAPELADVAKLLLHPLGAVTARDATSSALRAAFLAEMQVLTHTLI